MLRTKFASYILPDFLLFDGEGDGDGDGGAGASAEVKVPETPPSVEGDDATKLAADKAEADAKAAADAKATADAAKAKPKKDWRDDRIAKLTAQLKEAKFSGKPAGDDPAAKQAELDKLVNQRAEQLAVQREFEKQAADARMAGQAEYGDKEFDAAVVRITDVVDRENPQEVQAYSNLVNAALETGEAHKVLFELSKDQSEASRIMALSPARMGAAVARLAAKPVEEVTKAPKPISPIGSGKGASRSEINPGDKDRSDGLTTAEWMNRREAEAKKQLEARGYR